MKNKESFMKKLITLVWTLFLAFGISYGQTHYVIAFDCTKSMDHPNAFEDGDYSVSSRDVTKVWEPAKMAVKDIFENADNADRITIILFQDKVLDICDGQRIYLQWNEINKRMENAIKSPGNTCILSAWDCAEQYLAKSSASKTVFYLITDGEEEHDTKAMVDEEAIRHTDELCQRILLFCETHNNTEGFYTNLVRSLHNNAINRALEQSDCFKTIIAGRFDSEIIVDMDEEKENYSQIIPVIFHPEDRDRVAVSIDNIEMITSNDYLSITLPNGQINQNKLDVKIELKNTIPSDVIENGCYSFPVTIKSQHSAKHIIHEQTVLFRVNFKKSSVVFLPTNEFVGKSTYQKPFSLLKNVSPKLAAERGPSMIRFNLDSIMREEYGQADLFNEEAVRQVAEFQLRLVSRNDKPVPSVTMFYNGQPCENLTATIRSTDSQHIIELLFDKTCKAKRYNHLQFEVVDGSVQNLDRINANAPCHYNTDVNLTYNVKSNPWYVAVIWIFVLIFLILLAWIIIANFSTRKMRGHLEPEGLDNVMLEGKVRGILTNKHKKQKVLSSLFTGPTVYSRPDDFWSTDLMVKKGRNFNMILIMPTDKYEIDGEIRTVPYPVIKVSDFSIRNIEQNKTITINYL